MLALSTIMSLLVTIGLLVVCCPCTILSNMACSTVQLREMQASFTTCSRMKIEREQLNLDRNTSCLLVERVLIECGGLWERCHSKREVRRMKDLHIEAMVRQYGEEGLDTCEIVKEYR